MAPLAVTIIQTPLFWEDIDRNLKMFSDKIKAIKERTDLIVLPEMFTTGFSMNVKTLAEHPDGKTLQWMKEQAKKKKCVIAGSYIVEGAYNRLIWMKEDGSYETYDKRHLFRFAGEDQYFKAGKKRLITTINGWRICPLICYDLRFPVWSRNNNDYDCLIYVANWPEARRKAWNTLLEARAHENQCYVVGVNRVGKDGKDIAYSGDSTIIDPKGNSICDTGVGQETTQTVKLSYAVLESFRKKFPVSLDADQFILK